VLTRFAQKRATSAKPSNTPPYDCFHAEYTPTSGNIKKGTQKRVRDGMEDD
jgi:hypothetical protein